VGVVIWLGLGNGDWPGLVRVGTVGTAERRGLADKRGIILRRVKQYNAKCKMYLGSPDVVLFIDDDIV